MTTSTQELIQRREQTETAWHQYFANPHQSRITLRGISNSWKRSQNALPPQRSMAPLTNPMEARNYWQKSEIRRRAIPEIEQLKQLALENESVAMISDPTGRLIWTHASPRIQQLAENGNLVTGSDCNERSTGTNAVGLCLLTRKPITVFSAEHYLSYLHDWVCYAAPIIHPGTGHLLGVLNLSSSWERYTPLGYCAVNGLAQAIAHRLPKQVYNEQTDLHIALLGQPNVLWRGKKLALSLRHCEILCLLALHPEGLTLDALHAAIYGDQSVSRTTLKSEISTLRNRLDGRIASRPYRLEATISADFLDVWEALRNQQVERALELYRDALLPDSNSPEIQEWRYCIEAMMSDNLESLGDFRSVLEHPRLCRSPLVREQLMELIR